MPRTKQKAKKILAAEAKTSQAYDHDKFISVAAQELYLKIRNQTILPERILNLPQDQFLDFQDELVRRHWEIVAKPRKFFHADLVREFYANACSSAEALSGRYSVVRGVQVPFDQEAINIFLGELWDGTEPCQYQLRMDENAFDDEEVRQALILPGIPLRAVGGTVKRCCMRRLAVIWTSFLLWNVCPNPHVSDLPAYKCRLLWTILQQQAVDVSNIMSSAIAEAVEKKATTMVLPSLITALCISAGAYDMEDTTHETELKEFNAAYINTHCIERPLSFALEKLHVQPDPPAEAATEIPAPLPPAPPSLASTTSILHRLDRIDQQQWACYSAVTGLYSILSTQPGFVGPSSDAFVRQFPWPEDQPQSSRGEAATAEATADTEMADTESESNCF